MAKLILLAIIITGLAACNTIQGAGEDIQGAGEGIAHTATKVKEKL